MTLVVKIGKKHYEAHSVTQAVEVLLKSVNVKKIDRR